MDPFAVKHRIRAATKDLRLRRRRVLNSEVAWDQGHISPRLPAKRNRIVIITAIVAAVIAGVCLVWVQRPRPVTQYSRPAEVVPPLPLPADQERAAKEAKLALDCIAGFFSAPNDLMRLAQLRAYPELVKTYEAYQKDLADLTKTTPLPGGNLKRNPPFVGIPLNFEAHTPVIAWVEIRENTARLDLDSLLGVGAVRWHQLKDSEAGARVFLRGTLTPISGSSSQMDFISPDGKQRIRISSAKPADLTEPRLARITIERTPETPIRRAGWVLAEMHGWDWLAAPLSK